MNEQCDFHPDHHVRCVNPASRLVWIDGEPPEDGFYLRVCEDCYAYARGWWGKHGWTWEA